MAHTEPGTDLPTYEIPVVDLCMMQGSDQDRWVFSNRFLGALQATGFIAVTNHGFPRADTDALYASAREVFTHPDNLLARYDAPQFQREVGSLPYGIETATSSEYADPKCGWSMRRPVPPGHPYRRSLDFMENLLPAEVPSFGRLFELFFRRLADHEYIWCEAIEICYGLPGGTLTDELQMNSTVARVIQYPENQQPHPTVLSAEHCDLSFLTTLLCPSDSGLEIQLADGCWVRVAHPPGSIIVDIGESFAKWSERFQQSVRPTNHRVIRPPNTTGSREIAVGFTNFGHHFVLGRDSDGREYTVGDFRLERLAAIGH